MTISLTILPKPRQPLCLIGRDLAGRRHALSRRHRALRRLRPRRGLSQIQHEVGDYSLKSVADLVFESLIIHNFSKHRMMSLFFHFQDVQESCRKVGSGCRMSGNLQGCEPVLLDELMFMFILHIRVNPNPALFCRSLYGNKKCLKIHLITCTLLLSTHGTALRNFLPLRIIC